MSDAYPDHDTSSDQYTDVATWNASEQGGETTSLSGTDTSTDSGSATTSDHDIDTESTSETSVNNTENNGSTDQFSNQTVGDADVENGFTVSTEVDTDTDESTDWSNESGTETDSETTSLSAGGSESDFDTITTTGNSNDSQSTSDQETINDIGGLETTTQVVNETASGSSSETTGHKGSETFNGIPEDGSDYGGSGSFTETDTSTDTNSSQYTSNLMTDPAGNATGTETSTQDETDTWNNQRTDTDNVSTNGTAPDAVTVIRHQSGTETSHDSSTATLTGGAEVDQEAETSQAQSNSSVSASDAQSDDSQATGDDSVNAMHTNAGPDPATTQTSADTPSTTASGAPTPALAAAEAAQAPANGANAVGSPAEPPRVDRATLEMLKAQEARRNPQPAPDDEVDIFAAFMSANGENSEAIAVFVDGATSDQLSGLGRPILPEPKPTDPNGPLPSPTEAVVQFLERGLQKAQPVILVVSIAGDLVMIKLGWGLMGAPTGVTQAAGIGLMALGFDSLAANWDALNGKPRASGFTQVLMAAAQKAGATENEATIFAMEVEAVTYAALGAVESFASTSRPAVAASRGLLLDLLEPGVTQRSAAILGERPNVSQWRLNPGGVVRAEEEIADVLSRSGVRVPKDVSIFVGNADEFYGTIDDVFAGRGGLTAKLPPLTENKQGLVYFSDLKNRFGKIPIQINPAMMQSDEAIAAVVRHELSELSLFRNAFKEGGGSMTFDAFRNEAIAGNPGNFHSQAWDAADALIIILRGD